jgi:HSP90 family molecular chaperone
VANRKREWPEMYQELMDRCVKAAILRMTAEMKGKKVKRKKKKGEEETEGAGEPNENGAAANGAESKDIIPMCLAVLRIHAKAAKLKRESDEAAAPIPLDPKVAEKMLAVLAGE